MARHWPFRKRTVKNGARKPAERIQDLRIVTHDFALINGEAFFLDEERRSN